MYPAVSTCRDQTLVLLDKLKSFLQEGNDLQANEFGNIELMPEMMIITIFSLDDI